jgi:hypothetical protein
MLPNDIRGTSLQNIIISQSHPAYIGRLRNRPEVIALLFAFTETQTRIIGAIAAVVIICLVIYTLFFMGSEPQDYEVTYDSKEGIITIEFYDEIPSADWAAFITYEVTESDHTTTKVVTNHGKVVLSENGHRVTITDDSGVLINLGNYKYDIELYSMTGSEKSIHCYFVFNGHEYGLWEIVGIALVIGLAAVAFIGSYLKKRY